MSSVGMLASLQVKLSVRGPVCHSELANLCEEKKRGDRPSSEHLACVSLSWANLI